jgi:hypothetical protein
MSVARASGKTPLQNMQEAANEIQGRRRAPAPSICLRDYATAQSGQLISVAAKAPIVRSCYCSPIPCWLRGYISGASWCSSSAPSLSRKKDAVRILEEIDMQVQRYLLATLMPNALVAIGTWLAFEALGMERAGVWGVAAGVLHFIPYLVICVVNNAT